MLKYIFLIVSLLAIPSFAHNPLADSERTFALPSLTLNEKGQAVAYWAEKDDANTVYLYFATSPDGGQTFGEKQLIFADAGIGTGRLARPKLLFKKDGTMVAVFSFRAGGMPQRPAKKEAKPEMNHSGGHNAASTERKEMPKGERPKRSSQILFTESKDGGKTWTKPSSVDKDETPLVRGFFDAVVLANDEIAIAYLKDVKNTTKHEERDLRLVLTKNGVFQEEKLIDPVVCDCCNISLLVDSEGKLNIFYRDNNSEIRDISVLTSSDNGATFAEPKTIYDDKWKIHGCPHAGPSSTATANNSYVTWFSGASESGGVRLLDRKTGQLLSVLNESAKNGYVASDKQSAVWTWEESDESDKNAIFVQKIQDGKVAASQKVEGSDYGQNPSILLVNGKVLVAYEIAKPDQKVAMKIELLK